LDLINIRRVAWDTGMPQKANAVDADLVELITRKIMETLGR
jgi:hypothetical protein